MSRLQWTGRACSNPPEGWKIQIWNINGQSYWKAELSADDGPMYCGPNVPTEAEAKRACEAALLRLGVLEPGEDCIAAAKETVRLLELVGTIDTNADLRSRDAITLAFARALAALEVEAEG
jgi:hypothetical protein